MKSKLKKSRVEKVISNLKNNSNPEKNESQQINKENVQTTPPLPTEQLPIPLEGIPNGWEIKFSFLDDPIIIMKNQSTLEENKKTYRQLVRYIRQNIDFDSDVPIFTERELRHVFANLKWKGGNTEEYEKAFKLVCTVKSIFGGHVKGEKMEKKCDLRVKESVKEEIKLNKNGRFDVEFSNYRIEPKSEKNVHLIRKKGH